MATGVSIEFSKRAQELLAAPGGLTPRVRNAIQRAMNAQMEETAGQIVEKRMSFPRNGKTTLEGLRLQTGRLARSMMRNGADGASKKAEWNAFTCIGSIGTNVRYAAIHEFGGTFSRVLHATSRAFVQKFKFGGKSIKRTVVRIGFRKAHSVTYPARAPVTKTVEERRAFFSAAVSRAIEEASK